MTRTPCRKCRTHRCYHKRGGRSRAKSLTREHQQAARAHVRRENLVQNGKKSFALIAAKYGFQWMAERVAQWRRAHPSAIEQTVMQWLDARGESYEHDRPFMGFAVYPDFQLHAQRLIVEVDGRGWHSNGGPHGEDREQRDAQKDALYTREGYRVLRLCESCVRDGSGEQLLVAALEVQP